MILERNTGESAYSLLSLYIDREREIYRERESKTRLMLNRKACQFSVSYLSFWKNNFTGCDGSCNFIQDLQRSAIYITSNHASGFEINRFSLLQSQKHVLLPSCWQALIGRVLGQASVKSCQFVISLNRALNRLFWWYLQPSH